MGKTWEQIAQNVWYNDIVEKQASGLKESELPVFFFVPNIIVGGWVGGLKSYRAHAYMRVRAIR